MKRDLVYLDHIREALERITAYSAAGREKKWGQTPFL